MFVPLPFVESLFYCGEGNKDTSSFPMLIHKFNAPGEHKILGTTTTRNVF